jgi:ornithine carbamoyltransferase
VIPAHLKGHDFLRVNDWEAADLLTLLEVADRLKARQEQRVEHHYLPGRTLGMIFQKPSTRTRVSFEVGIAQLGGSGLYLAAGDLQLGRGETIKDTARVLSRYLDGIMIRTFKQSDVDELAAHADIPVINGLTDEFHPCQALADVMTIRERFETFEGVRVAYLGDGNNVCHSLMVACAKLGMHFRAASPEGYAPSPEVVAWADTAAQSSGGSVAVHRKPLRAPTSSTPTCGRAWARTRSASAGCRISPLTGSTTISCGSHPTAPSSCTASRPTTARRSPRKSCTALALPCGTRRRTGCTRRRP